MFNHYIAVDWAQSNMAIARMTGSTNNITTIDVPASIKELQLYLSKLRGKKILTVEESTTSQWLYTELREHVDELIICDPYRNHLLKEGAKSDKIDAEKLVRLLRAGMLKSVFHSGNEFIKLRKLVSGYIDVVRGSTCLKNQRAALYRSFGKTINDEIPGGETEKFVLDGNEQALLVFEKERIRYEEEFAKLAGAIKNIRLLKSLPGIQNINAVKILAMVVDPRRFPTPGHFWSYCGLFKLDRISGGRSYGKLSPRCNRILKDVFKGAAMASTREGANNPMRDYYVHLVTNEKLADYHARHAVARRIATLALGILKSGQKFDPRRGACREKLA